MAIALAEALERSLTTRAASGFVGKLLGSGDRSIDLVLAAASQSHVALGGLARDRGDLATSVREYTAALELAKRMRKADLATGVAMLELGHTTQLQGHQEEAEGWLRKAHPLLVQSQGSAYIPLDMYLLGIVQAAMQRWDEALETLERTEDSYAEHGLGKGVLDARLARADILIRTGRSADAEPLARAASDMAEQLREPLYLAQARWHLSRIKRIENRPDDAINLLRDAIELYEQVGDKWHLSQSFMVVAEIEQQLGRLDDASRALDQAQAIAKAMKSPLLEADGTYARATLRRAAGDKAEARRLLEQAKIMFAAQGRDDQVRKADSELDTLRADGQ